MLARRKSERKEGLFSLSFEGALHKLLISPASTNQRVKRGPAPRLQAPDPRQINSAPGIVSLCLQIFISELNKNGEKAPNTSRGKFVQQGAGAV